MAGIVALGKAASLMREGMEERMRYVASLRDRLIDGALKIERSRLNGDREKRLPGNASFCFEGVEGESLLLLLDFQGISAHRARPVRPVPWTRAMCCSQLVCHMKSHTVRCG